MKETFFFDQYYERGLDWYYSHFKNASVGVALGEVGPTYFESALARERIQYVNPAARVLITVRNPIARSFSSFQHEYAKGRTSYDFFEAIKRQPRIIDAGRYGILAPEWERALGHDQVLYVMQENIDLTPQRELDTICGFLGVYSIQLPEELYSRYGQGTVPRFRVLAAAASRIAKGLRRAGLHRMVEVGKGLGLKRVYTGGDWAALTMTRSIFEHLRAEHEVDIRFLEERLGRDFSYWRDPVTYDLTGE